MFFLSRLKWGRVFVTCYMLFFVVLVVASWVYWHRMGVFLKGLIVLLEIFLIPDIGVIKKAYKKPEI